MAWVASRESAATRPPFQLGWVLGLRWLVAGCGIAVGVAAAALGLLPARTEWVLCGFVLWVTLTQLLVVRRWVRNEARGGDGRHAPHLGWLFSADILALTATLYFTGGAANPFSALYLVYISLAAVALGTRWAWGLMLLCCLSYAGLFVPPPDAISEHAHHAHHAHHAMTAAHEETSLLNTHLAGMWWAFAVSAGIAVFFLTRLAQEIRARDEQLRLAREQRERYTRLASMMSLAASAAHELGTPLGTIAVVANELERELPDHLKAEAQLVRREVDRCRKIVDRLSVRSGELVGERPAPLELEGLVELVRAELPQDYQARLDVQLGARAPLLLPPHAFAVAVANLVMNGFEASGPEARVGLSLSVSDGTLRVEVQDAGSGLGDAQLPELFDPFVTTKAERGGLGLGLYVVRILMESLQGSLIMRPGQREGTIAELRVAARVEART